MTALRGASGRFALGAGLPIALPALLYLAASWLASAHGSPLFRLPGQHRWWTLAGVVLIAVGLSLYMRILLVLHRARNRQALAQTGPYARVRHPSYAVWLFLILPGIALFSGSWLVLLTPLVYYAGIRAFIQREEDALAAQFGEAYAAYRQRTHLLVPWARHGERTALTRGRSSLPR